MGLCCSCEIVDGDAFRRPYPPELTPTPSPASPDEGTTVEVEQTPTSPPPEQAAHGPRTNNREALERARAARQRMPLPTVAGLSEPAKTEGERV